MSELITRKEVVLANFHHLQNMENSIPDKNPTNSSAKTESVKVDMRVSNHVQPDNQSEEDHDILELDCSLDDIIFMEDMATSEPDTISSHIISDANHEYEKRNRKMSSCSEDSSSSNQLVIDETPYCSKNSPPNHPLENKEEAEKTLETKSQVISSNHNKLPGEHYYFQSNGNSNVLSQPNTLRQDTTSNIAEEHAVNINNETSIKSILTPMIYNSLPIEENEQVCHHESSSVFQIGQTLEDKKKSCSVLPENKLECVKLSEEAGVKPPKIKFSDKICYSPRAKPQIKDALSSQVIKDNENQIACCKLGDHQQFPTSSSLLQSKSAVLNEAQLKLAHTETCNTASTAEVNNNHPKTDKGDITKTKLSTKPKARQQRRVKAQICSTVSLAQVKGCNVTSEKVELLSSKTKSTKTKLAEPCSAASSAKVLKNKNTTKSANSSQSKNLKRKLSVLELTRRKMAKVSPMVQGAAALRAKQNFINSVNEKLVEKSNKSLSPRKTISDKSTGESRSAEPIEDKPLLTQNKKPAAKKSINLQKSKFPYPKNSADTDKNVLLKTSGLQTIRRRCTQSTEEPTFSEAEQSGDADITSLPKTTCSLPEKSIQQTKNYLSSNITKSQRKRTLLCEAKPLLTLRKVSAPSVIVKAMNLPEPIYPEPQHCRDSFRNPDKPTENVQNNSTPLVQNNSNEHLIKFQVKCATKKQFPQQPVKPVVFKKRTPCISKKKKCVIEECESEQIDDCLSLLQKRSKTHDMSAIIQNAPSNSIIHTLIQFQPSSKNLPPGPCKRLISDQVKLIAGSSLGGLGKLSVRSDIDEIVFELKSLGHVLKSSIIAESLMLAAVEKSPIYNSEYEPPLTEAQHVVLQIVARLDDNTQHGQDKIADILLRIIPQCIVLRAAEPIISEEKEQCLLAELFVRLCMSRKDLTPARILLFDVVFYLRLRAVAIAYSMLMQDSHLLLPLRGPSAPQTKHATIEDLPLPDQCMLHFFLQLDPSDEPHCKVTQLHTLLKFNYNITAQQCSEDQLLHRIIGKVKCGEMQYTKECLCLLAKKNDISWTKYELVEGVLQDMLDSHSDSPEADLAAQFAATLTGLTVKLLPLPELSFKLKVIAKLKEMLYTDCSMALQESIIDGLLYMTHSLHLNEVLTTLRDWVPPQPISNSLLSHLKTWAQRNLPPKSASKRKC